MRAGPAGGPGRAPARPARSTTGRRVARFDADRLVRSAGPAPGTRPRIPPTPEPARRPVTTPGEGRSARRGRARWGRTGGGRGRGQHVRCRRFRPIPRAYRGHAAQNHSAKRYVAHSNALTSSYVRSGEGVRCMPQAVQGGHIAYIRGVRRKVRTRFDLGLSAFRPGIARGCYRTVMEILKWNKGD